MAEAGIFPLDDEPLTPAEELAAATRSAVAATRVLLPVPEPIPFGMSWAFDFRNERFVRRGSSPVELFGQNSLRVWIEAAIRTAQGAYPVFTDAFGIEEPDELIGRVDLSETVGDYEGKIRDALLVHDRIAAVTDFQATFDAGDDVLFLSFTVETDTGDRIPVGGLEVPA